MFVWESRLVVLSTCYCVFSRNAGGSDARRSEKPDLEYIPGGRQAGVLIWAYAAITEVAIDTDLSWADGDHWILAIFMKKTQKAKKVSWLFLGDQDM